MDDNLNAGQNREVLRALVALVDEQARIIDELQQRVGKLELADHVLTEPSGGVRMEAENKSSEMGSEPEFDQPVPASVSRRRMLIGAAAAVGGAAALVRVAEPAAAADGGNVVLGQTNDSTSPTLIRRTGSTNPAVLLDVTHAGTGSGILGVGGPAKEGVTGRSNGSLSSVGVLGVSDTGFAVYGQGTSGYDIFAGGVGRLGMVSHATTLPPISGEYALGDIVRDASGNMFACVGAGTPGVWRKLAGPQTAGQLHLLPSPQQAAETRSGLGVAGTAPIPIGGSVTVNVGSTVPSVPAGATGVIGTIGAFAPSGPRFTASGNLAVVAGGAGPAGLAVTFLTGNDFAASLYVSALSAARTLSVFSYGSSAHVSMDVIGYFR